MGMNRKWNMKVFELHELEQSNDSGTPEESTPTDNPVNPETPDNPKTPDNPENPDNPTL